MRTPLGKHFSTDVLNGSVLHGSFLHTAVSYCDFWTQQFQKAAQRCTRGVVGYFITALLEIYW